MRLSARCSRQGCFESSIAVTNESSLHAALAGTVTVAVAIAAAATGFPCTSWARPAMRCSVLNWEGAATFAWPRLSSPLLGSFAG